jgi:hypothetical protein
MYHVPHDIDECVEYVGELVILLQVGQAEQDLVLRVP